ncbi:hypothetical protein SEA_BAZZLE_3 [Mycobacterium phage Bazzle]
MVSLNDYYALCALDALRLARWCREHATTLFFCEHKHADSLEKGDGDD